MVKFISTFSLKPDYDPDETYQIWVKEHVPYVKKVMIPELRQYVIGRVLHIKGLPACRLHPLPVDEHPVFGDLPRRLYGLPDACHVT